ncbi:hypothetical protein BDV18DRAFT_143982 [Aspergillus unguis]
MRFTIASILGMAAAASAAMSTSQMAAKINALTEMGSEADEVVKSMSAENVHTTMPQLVDDLNEIVATIDNDITAIDAHKRSLQARQVCANVEDPEQCLSDLSVNLEYLAEPLPSKKRSMKKRQAQPDFSGDGQQAVCTAFIDFINVYKGLAQQIVGKHGITGAIPLSDPFDPLVRAFVSGVNTILDNIANCGQNAIQNKQSLDRTLADAINMYSN